VLDGDFTRIFADNATDVQKETRKMIEQYAS
jgi:hypothetical protein